MANILLILFKINSKIKQQLCKSLSSLHTAVKYDQTKGIPRHSVCRHLNFYTSGAGFGRLLEMSMTSIITVSKWIFLLNVFSSLNVLCRQHAPTSYRRQRLMLDH